MLCVYFYINMFILFTFSED